jgi:hypothetical protein
MPETFSFLQNKYTKWYFNIISNAQNRDISDYFEKHHIIPKSLGGSNKQANLVNLTAREHFICHWLLTKMTIGDARHKMLAAVHRMMVQKNSKQARITPFSRTYEILRSEWAKAHSSWLTGRYSGENNPNFGKKMSEENKKIISEKKTGKKIGPFTENHKQKISNALKGVPKSYGDKIKESWNRTYDQRVGENHPMYGKIHSDVTKEKMKTASANRWTPEARNTFSIKKKELNRLKKLKELNNESPVTL